MDNLTLTLANKLNDTIIKCNNAITQLHDSVQKKYVIATIDLPIEAGLIKVVTEAIESYRDRKVEQFNKL